VEELRILAIDESATMRRIIVSTLRRAGFDNVVEATDGRGAFAALENDPFDFVIANLNMSDMDGLEFVTQVRQTSEYGNPPILMVTSRSVKNEITQAIDAGVSNYIVRPFTPDTLKDKIVQTIERAGQVGKGQRSGG
jgi:two-component system chemotaxis response regulator CheY